MPEPVWNKPLLNHLPIKGYQDNPDMRSLTSWVDAKYRDKVKQLEDFYLQLNPDTADDDMLDYLAYLVGLSGYYWDATWSAKVKRRMIALAYPVLWAKRGTLDCIRAALDVHELVYDIWVDGVNILPFYLPVTLSNPKLRFYIRLDSAYTRNGREWREAERVLNNYCPAVIKSAVTYKAFILGASVVGDPVFNNPSRVNITDEGQPITSDGSTIVFTP